MTLGTLPYIRARESLGQRDTTRPRASEQLVGHPVGYPCGPPISASPWLHREYGKGMSPFSCIPESEALGPKRPHPREAGLGYLSSLCDNPHQQGCNPKAESQNLRRQGQKPRAELCVPQPPSSPPAYKRWLLFPTWLCPKGFFFTHINSSNPSANL